MQKNLQCYLNFTDESAHEKLRILDPNDPWYWGWYEG
jgi:hypothetical protein